MLSHSHCDRSVAVSQWRYVNEGREGPTRATYQSRVSEQVTKQGNHIFRALHNSREFELRRRAGSSRERKAHTFPSFRPAFELDIEPYVHESGVALGCGLQTTGQHPCPPCTVLDEVHDGKL